MTFLMTSEIKMARDTVKKVLTAWPSSSVSPSSGVEEEGESDPAKNKKRED